MQAAYIEQTGGPEVIQFGDLPDPLPKSGEVLVRVGAASVNPIDTYTRGGMIATELPMPFVVGSDLAGTVEAVGEGVTQWEIGNRVWGANQGGNGRQGTSAEYACVNADWLHATPDGVSDEHAAAVALVGITAHIGLVLRAKVAMGETVFVNGGAGGVGSMVVQISKALGARVIATAGSDERVATAKALGADEGINYKTEDVAERVKELAPDGVNVLWETRRDTDFERTIGLLAQRGRMVVMAGRDARPVLPVGPLYVKDCSVHGFAMFNYTAEEQRPCGEHLNRWLSEGKLKANIDRVLPLSEAAAAHQLQEENTLNLAGTLAGKIVLKP
ncbi:MAG: NADPH:quinone reductase [Verrucomicrobia subdivision 3 bacterium]|nr:NADPH:quinone reductase [Limisphaerales bacterium]